MLKELVKGAASLTATVAGALLHEVAEKLPVVDQVARKVGLRPDESGESGETGAATKSCEPHVAAPLSPPMPHNVPNAVAEVLSRSEGQPTVKAKRGQKHGHH